MIQQLVFLKNLIIMVLLMMKNKILLFNLLILLSFFGCKNEESFSIEKWNLKIDGMYLKREVIAKDLIKNRLKRGMCYKDVVKLLGTNELFTNQRCNNCIYYELRTKYGSDIDPDWIKLLEIKLDKDSCYVGSTIIKVR